MLDSRFDDRQNKFYKQTKTGRGIERTAKFPMDFVNSMADEDHGR